MATVKIQFPEPLERFYYFTDDQVLTAGQLNQLAGHFDHEHRLTRTKGLGIGIICGLEVSVENNARIRLTKGAAITSSGDLIKVGADTVFARFVKIQDENTVASEDGSVRVLRLGMEQQPIPMWRLFEAPTGNAQPVDGSEPLDTLGATANLQDLALVLLLDDHCKEPEECTDTNCDNMGITQMNDLLAVLVPKQSLIPAVNHPNRFLQLPQVAIRKVDLSGGTIKDVDNLQDRFKAAISNSTKSIMDSISKIGEAFPDVMNLAFGNKNPLPGWLNNLGGLLAKSEDKPHIQHLYGFYKDLAQALNEFKECVRLLPGECCPSVELFPKYIMASELVLPAGNRYPIFRHYFNESPILNGAHERLGKAVFLLRRLDEMIAAFDATLSFTGNNADKVRVSPSMRASQPLGSRAIPVYYDLRKRPELKAFWDYDKSTQGLEDAHQGYWMQEISAMEEVREPFAFERDASDFYRIEGVLNLKAEDAEKRVNDLRVQHNLGFKIETIQIEDQPLVIPKPIQFPDLNIMFRHYREELQSNLQLAQHYNLTLEKAFDQADQEELKKAKDADGTDAFTNIKSAVGADSKSFNQTMEKVTTKMYRKLDTFEADFSSFRKEYDTVATVGQTIDKKVSYSKQATLNSPINRLVLENSYRRFDYIIDIFKKRKENLRKQYIFDRFFGQNPGLVHTGGVPEGGTFVMAYSATTGRVVADFSLPYCCVVEVPEEEDHTPPPSIDVRPLPGNIFTPLVPNKPFPWLDKFDLVATPRIPKDIFTVKDFGLKLTLLDKPEELFKVQFADFEKSFTTKFTELNKKLETQEAQFSTKFNSQEAQFNQKIDTQRSTYENLLNAKDNNFTTKLNEQKASFDQQLAKQTEVLNANIEKTVDTQVKGQAFDVIANAYTSSKSAIKPGGATDIFVDPGRSLLGIAATDIKDADTRAKVKELDFTTERLGVLKANPQPTVTEKREIKILESRAETLTLELAIGATSGGADIRAGSDNELVLNALSEVVKDKQSVMADTSVNKIKEELNTQLNKSATAGKPLEANRIKTVLGSFRMR